MKKFKFIILFLCIFLCIGCNDTENKDTNKEDNLDVSIDLPKDTTDEYLPAIDSITDNTTDTSDSSNVVYSEENGYMKITRYEDTCTIEEYYADYYTTMKVSYIYYDNGIVCETNYYDTGFKHTIKISYTDNTYDFIEYSEDNLYSEKKLADGTKFVSTYYLNGTVKTDVVYHTNGRVDSYVYYENGNTQSIDVTLSDGTKYHYEYNQDGTIKEAPNQ